MKKLWLVLLTWMLVAQCAWAVVNINTAPQAELEKLQGIGPAKAKAIVEDRAKNGVFKNIDELKRVKGIGEATFDKLKGDITVTGVAEPQAPTKKASK